MACMKDSRFLTMAEVGRKRYTVDLVGGNVAGSGEKSIQVILDTNNKIKGAVDNYQISHNNLTYVGSTLSDNLSTNLNIRFEVGYNEKNQLIAYIHLYNAGSTSVSYNAQHFEVDVCYFMPPENAK